MMEEKLINPLSDHGTHQCVCYGCAMVGYFDCGPVATFNPSKQEATGGSDKPRP